MIVKREIQDSEVDLPVVYTTTYLGRSALLAHDPGPLLGFANTTAEYAILAYDDQEQIQEYIDAEFRRAYGDSVQVRSKFEPDMYCVQLSMHLSSDVAPIYSIKVH